MILNLNSTVHEHIHKNAIHLVAMVTAEIKISSVASWTPVPMDKASKWMPPNKAYALVFILTENLKGKSEIVLSVAAGVQKRPIS